MEKWDQCRCFLVVVHPAGSRCCREYSTRKWPQHIVPPSTVLLLLSATLIGRAQGICPLYLLLWRVSPPPPLRNTQKVDTGTGVVTEGAAAEHARCLVRALCRLLRRVSLHALLKGAGQTASPGNTEATGGAGSAKKPGVEVRARARAETRGITEAGGGGSSCSLLWMFLFFAFFAIVANSMVGQFIYVYWKYYGDRDNSSGGLNGFSGILGWAACITRKTVSSSRQLATDRWSSYARHISSSLC